MKNSLTVRKNDLNLPIYLAGISMGASTVLMTAGFDLPDNVHGIMADCGFTSADAIWRYVTENKDGYEQAMTEFWVEFDTKCINNY